MDKNGDIFIKACKSGDFKSVFSYPQFNKLSESDINHGYYHACDNGHNEIANALYATGKINKHTNSMAFVDASEKCNLLLAQQTYITHNIHNTHVSPIEFSEVRWALHKAHKNKCSDVVAWLKTLRVTI